MTDRNTIADVLGHWREEAERGRRMEPDLLVSSHPDMAPELRRHFAAQDVLDQFFADADERPVAPPEVLGDFRLGREIGRGGMGVVYEAEQVSMGRRVALKVLFPTIATTVATRKRFENEARTTGHLHHTNIVMVHAMGRQEGYLYFAMELVEGSPLDDVIAHLAKTGRGEEGSPAVEGLIEGLRGSGRYARAAEMFAGIADALEVAHAKGVIHRDVKPSNLILDPEGRLKLTDFGLARLIGDRLGVTCTGDVIGTPLYMSPEQIRGMSEDIDPRTDVYSLGATLYEFLTLERAHGADEIAALCSQVLTQDPVPARQRVPGIPRDLATIGQKAMEKDRADRYASAGAMARDLRAFARGRSIAARPVGPLVRTWRRVKRHPIRSSLVAALSALVIAVAVLAWSNAEHTEAVRERRYLDLLESAAEARLESWVASPSIGGSKWAPAGLAAAHKALTDAIELIPNRPEAWAERAQLGSGSLEDRLADLEAARERHLGEGLYWANRGYLLLNSGDQAGAEAAFREAQRHGETIGNHAFHLLGYQVARRRDDAQEALVHLDALLGDPELPQGVRSPVLLMRARLRMGQDDVPGAMEDLLGIPLRDTRGQVRLRVQIALLWARLGQPERKQEIIESVFAETATDGSIRAWEDLNAALSGLASGPLYGRSTKEALAAHPEHVQFLHSRILYLIGPTWGHEATPKLRDGRSRHELALKLIDRVRDRHPDPKRLLLLEANALVRLQRFDEARVVLDKATALGDIGLHGRLMRASVLRHAGRMDDALVILKRLAAEDPDAHSGHCSLATYLHYAGRNEEALTANEAAIRTDPNCAQTRLLQVAILLNLNRHEEVVAAADKALPLAPGHWPTYRFKGFALFQLGRYSESAAALDVSLKASRQLKVSNELTVSIQCGNRRLLGESREAWALLEELKAMGARPLMIHPQEAQLLADQGKWREAIASLERGQALAPEPNHADGAAFWSIQKLYYLYAAGRVEEARSLAASLIDSPHCQGIDRVRAAVLLGRHDEARQYVEAHEWKSPSVFQPGSALVWKAGAYALLGEKTKALELVSRAADAGFRWPPHLAPDADLQRIWNEPAFVALRAKHAAVR